MNDKKVKQAQNSTVINTSGGISKALIKLTPKQIAEGDKMIRDAQEQERTRIKKKMFLEYWEKSRGVVSVTCDKVEISRQAFYNWKEDDKEFVKALELVTNKTKNEVVDILMGKIMIEKDGPSVRYWLDRKHPEFKPSSITEIIAGERTIEDLIAEADAKVEEQQKLYDEQHNKSKAKQIDESKADILIIEDKKQEGIASTIHTKQSAEVLSGKDDQKKPNTKS